MSEEEYAIKFLENKTTDYGLESEVLHYYIILYNLIKNLQQQNKQLKETIKNQTIELNRLNEEQCNTRYNQLKRKYKQLKEDYEQEKQELINWLKEQNKLQYLNGKIKDNYVLVDEVLGRLK